jgi:predicted GIY-YIG superfamily endonuclease
MNQKQPAIYILCNKPNGTLYTGVTSNLIKRVWEHRHDVTQCFTSKYNCKYLVYYELIDDMGTAIAREKQIKAGSRSNKIDLILSINPDWVDLYPSITG